MDTKSHLMFGQVLLNCCKQDISYAEWATAPDIDFDKKLFSILLHRYWRHRISTLPEIFAEYSAKYPSALTEDKIAIALCILSHLYLDIFNGWVFCWGFSYPATHMSSNVIKEYARDLNQNLLDHYTEKQQTFFNESQTIFEQIPPLRNTDAFLALLSELVRFTSGGVTPQKATTQINSFTGLNLTYNSLPILTPITTRYYNFLKSFFQETTL